jgi:hypothetical protein
MKVMTILRALTWIIILGMTVQAYPDGKERVKGSENYISESPHGATVFIIQPLDGDKFKTDEPIDILFGLKGMGVAPAGVQVDKTGHHHLLIDQAVMPDFDKAIPASAKIIHYGKGQTQTSIKLSPGKHTLQLLLGNHYHIPHDPPLFSKKIEIEVYE